MGVALDFRWRIWVVALKRLRITGLYEYMAYNIVTQYITIYDIYFVLDHYFDCNQVIRDISLTNSKKNSPKR